MKSKINVLIVGAGVAGSELLSEINKNLKNVYKVKGFIDDDDNKVGKKILSVKVLGKVKNLSKLIHKYKIGLIFVAIPSAKGEDMRRIFNICKGEKIVVKVVPRTLELVEGKVKLEGVRDIQIEDLLGRSIIKSEQRTFKKEFKDKIILVTGAAGSIGSELTRQLLQFSPKLVIGLDRWENGLYQLNMELQKFLVKGKFLGVICDIKEKESFENIIKKFKPEYIFHAAAYKHVPLMQQYPKEAVRNNVFGTKNISIVAGKYAVKKFINISTDKAVNPTSIMGTTKLIGENIVRSMNSKMKTKYISVRFGNVLGSNGSVVPIFKKQIAQGGPVTVTDKRMVRYFMTIPEAVQLVLNASIMGNGGEIFILDMGEQISILSLAESIIRLSGFIPYEEMPIIFTGKRPGEKVEEALITETEKLEKTKNKKIFKLSNSESKIEKTDDYLSDLKEALKKSSTIQLIRILKKVAPGVIYDRNDSIIES